jgi:hypothetical protein
MYIYSKERTYRTGHTGQDSQNGKAEQQEGLNRTGTTGNWHNRTAGLNGILGRKGGAWAATGQTERDSRNVPARTASRTGLQCRTAGYTC